MESTSILWGIQSRRGMVFLMPIYQDKQHENVDWTLKADKRKVTSTSSRHSIAPNVASLDDPRYFHLIMLKEGSPYLGLILMKALPYCILFWPISCFIN